MPSPQRDKCKKQPQLLRAIAFVGSVYLAWLGVGIMRAPFALDNTKTSGGLLTAFRHGLFTNLLNPKVILIFAGLMPNFVDAKLGAASLQFAMLGAVLIIINTIYQSALAFFWRCRARILRHRQQKTTNRAHYIGRRVADICRGVVCR